MLRSILPLLSVCISLLAWGLFSMPAYADEVPVIAVIVSNNADIAPVSSLAPNELRLI